MVSGDYPRFVHGVGSVSGTMGDFNAPRDWRDAAVAAESQRRAPSVCGLLM